MLSKSQQWMLYGATGYTGKLIIEEALKRGHKPILAGRNKSKLMPLAKKYGLEATTIDLNDTQKLGAAVEKVELVFHAAGPYVVTAEPMMQACIAKKTHYVDLTGEGPVFKRCFELSEQAKASGICLISGIGFDVIPTDCLMAYVAKQIDNPQTLEMAMAPIAKLSPGTMKSLLVLMKDGTVDIRENGTIKARKLSSITKTVNFPSGPKAIALAPYADVYTAYYSTGVKNIRTYVEQPTAIARQVAFSVPILKLMLSSKWFVTCLENIIDKRVHGPDESYRTVGSAEVWARAENAKGEFCEGGLKSGELYYLTSLLSVRFIEKILATNPSGSLAPAQLFSMSQLLEIEGITLYDQNQQLVSAKQVIEKEETPETA